MHVAANIRGGMHWLCSEQGNGGSTEWKTSCFGARVDLNQGVSAAAGNFYLYAYRGNNRYMEANVNVRGLARTVAIGHSGSDNYRYALHYMDFRINSHEADALCKSGTVQNS